MPRVDVWDVQAAALEPAPTLGLPRGLEERYTLGRTLGRGGFGLVRAATSVATGLEYACKTISKTLDLPDVSPAKRAQHLEGIGREIAVLRRLRGTLNVVSLEEARRAAPRGPPALRTPALRTRAPAPHQQRGTPNLQKGEGRSHARTHARRRQPAFSPPPPSCSPEPRRRWRTTPMCTSSWSCAAAGS